MYKRIYCVHAFFLHIHHINIRWNLSDFHMENSSGCGINLFEDHERPGAIFVMADSATFLLSICFNHCAFNFKTFKT